MDTDPYEILGIDPYSKISKSELKDVYKSMARKTHPDLGGSHDLFILVQKSYKQIFRQMRPIWKQEIMEKEHNNYFKTGEYSVVDTNINKEKSFATLQENFNHKQFHQEFEVRRMKSEFDVEPKNNLNEDEIKKLIVNPKKIKEKDFHQEFTTHLDQFMNTRTDIVKYIEPQAVNSLFEAELNILDREEISDFTTKTSTDFVKAYTKYNTIYQNINVGSKYEDKIANRQFESLVDRRNKPF